MNDIMNPSAPQPRSYLFVPGDRPERFDKAWDSPADEIILDLEDAVAPERKASARDAIASWLSADKPAWIRCNAIDTPWFEQDLELASQVGVRGLLLPKAESVPDRLLRLAEQRRIGVIALIETAAGLAVAETLARTPGVVRLAFGSIDFQVDLGIDGEGEELLLFRSRLVLASRLAGLPAPVDGVSVAVDDGERIREDTRRAKRLGLGAKLCIHPKQIPYVHQVFEPTQEERNWAARVIEATEKAGGAAANVDGKMVDRPVWLKALRVQQAPAAGLRLRR